jgi:multidrug efflux pump subunit AcrB
VAATEAALTAGHTRLRPIIMTAFAMIVGMLPMALGIAYYSNQFSRGECRRYARGDRG